MNHERRRAFAMAEKVALFVFVLLVVIFVPTSPLWSAGTASADVSTTKNGDNGSGVNWAPPSTPEEAAVRIEEIQKEMDLYLKQREKIQTDDGVEAEALRKLSVSLGVVQNAYSRYSAALDNLQRAKEEAAEAALSTTKSLIKEKPPYNLSFYEEVRNQYEGVDQKLKSALSSTRLSEENLESLKKQLSQQEAKVEELQKVAIPSEETEKNGLLLRETEAELEGTRVLIYVVKTNLEAYKVRKAFLEGQKELLEGDLALVKDNLQFDEDDRESRIEILAGQIAKARETQSALQQEREKLRSALNRANGELTSARTDQQRMVAKAGVAEQEAWLKYNQVAIEQTEQEITVLDEDMAIWGVRYDLIEGSVKSQEIWEKRSSASNRIKGLENLFQVQQRNLASVQAEILASQKELEEVKDNSPVFARVQRKIDALEKTVQATNAMVTRLLGLFNNYNRFLEELNNQIDAVRIAEQVTRFGKDRFLAFWNISLWTGEDFNVTIAKLVLAIFLFGTAFFLSGKLTAFLGRTLLKRMGLESSVRTAAQQILFYVFIVAFILSALDLVGIPLTAFAFLGGALAIGIGFGAQNFFNNLISGFIVMFSKPLRVGDTIEVDGLFAAVEEIGPRSTKVKTFDNIDVLIPNSYFLNNNIVNWTLTDQKIRRTLNVGVAHGSDVREVERLLLKAAGDHSRVLNKPEPFVAFTEIGASALEFTLYYWVDMATASTLKVGSDLRFRLVALFEDKNITVAFQQVDVHLDSRRPVEMTLRPPVEEAPIEEEDDEKPKLPDDK